MKFDLGTRISLTVGSIVANEIDCNDWDRIPVVW